MKLIKKQIVIDLTYGSEYQYRIKHNILLNFLQALEVETGSRKGLDYSQAGHVNNTVSLSGDTEMDSK